MPMPTMTKLPPDPLWSGGGNNIPDSDLRPLKLTSESSSSLISPLTLPRGVDGYFDHIMSQGAPPSAQLLGVPSSHQQYHHHQQQPRAGVYSPLSPGAKGPPPHAASLLSPRMVPVTKQAQFQLDQQQRSSSLPPKNRSGITSPRVAPRPMQDNMAFGHINGGSLGLSQGQGPAHGANNGAVRYPSADYHARAAYAETSSQDYIVQRLLQQKARMQEAWEAERKYLEANRERAEEVYKEERALMEEERSEWDAEKALLLAEIERLGGTNPLTAAAHGAHPWPGSSILHLTQRGGGGGSSGGGSGGGSGGVLSRVSPNSSLSSERNSQLSAQNGGGPGSRNASSSSYSIPVTRPAPDRVSPLSPNGPRDPQPDFLKPPPTEGSDPDADPVPSVDVGEIHPELEGIRIKSTSVKKPTFTDPGSQPGSSSSSKQSSPAGSPTSAPPPPEPAKSPETKKAAQTLQVLAAKEADRLTMHAGHTPNHSLSSLATVVSSGTATVTSNGGDSTPTTPSPYHKDDAAASGRDTPTADAAGGGITVRITDPDGAAQSGLDITDVPSAVNDNDNNNDHPNPHLQPSDEADRELKGPLMVRNMPAHDEVFFQKLSDRLEEVSKDDVAALPAVLKDAEPETETETSQAGAERAAADTERQGEGETETETEAETSRVADIHASRAAAEHAKTELLSQTQAEGDGGDKSAASDAESDDSSKSGGGETGGFDVPLKFKKRMNFGAPFGAMR
ncbi:hypothetical protein B0J18DRAFT_420256 [Chaetomium sp. MPI-SDFR-AT-0129]|nr:hypothetical protein B0J18DRAFT_420256 [Chaetomium sp. MPI-SDFR-AT-0129]